jgi:hypothetical protein
MKIRKILPLLAIVLVAAFILAGCDSVLETLFPNDTGHGGGSTPANNTISVTAFLWTDRYYATSAYFGKVHIDLMDSTGTTVVQSASQWVSGWDSSFYDSWVYYSYGIYYRYPIDASFNFVPDGTYTLRVYYDLNYNDKYDSPGEYYVSNQNTGSYFSYPLYLNSAGHTNIVVTGGQSVSARSYIDNDGWQYWSGANYN